MKAKYFICIVFVYITLLLNINFVFADNYTGREVMVSIESYDKTIATGKVNAFTFKESIEKFGFLKKIDIIFSQLGSVTDIYSINGIKNSTFNQKDGWSGYVLRDGVIIKEENFLNTVLQDYDQVFIYYGLDDYTQIVSDISMSLSKDIVTIDLRSKYFIEGKTIEQKLKNLKVHITNPDDTKKILAINNNGIIYTKLSKLGIYGIVVKDDSTDKYPAVVKTKDYYYFYGLDDNNSVTRAEAVAFIVNQYAIEKGSKNITFQDIDKSYKHYKAIDIAASNSIITGYDDGTFRPDEKINMMELCVLISPLFIDTESDTYEREETKLIPKWAKVYFNKILNKGVLDGVPIDFYRQVTSEDLIQINKNILQKWS